MMEEKETFSFQPFFHKLGTFLALFYFIFQNKKAFGFASSISNAASDEVASLYVGPSLNTLAVTNLIYPLDGDQDRGGQVVPRYGTFWGSNILGMKGF